MQAGEHGDGRNHEYGSFPRSLQSLLYFAAAQLPTSGTPIKTADKDAQLVDWDVRIWTHA